MELIFVAAILVLIATLTIPQFIKTFDFLQLQNFVSDVVSFARYAQAKAITDGRTNRLAFDFDKKYVMVESMGDDEKWHLEKSKPIPDFVSIDLQDSEGEIKFYPDGTADKAAIKISASSGKNFTVSIESVTGYVKTESSLQ